MDTKFDDIVSEIRQTVERFPDHVAIIEDGINKATYRQLWTNALCVAKKLIASPDNSDFVTIMLPKSERYITALLGCWIAGKAFVPIGDDLPYARKKYIVEAVCSDVCITESNYSDFLNNTPINRITPLTASTPAYIIFSSGTTGNPKGILVGHSGLVNLARCQREAFRISDQSRNLFFLSVNFDASISDILVTLTSGAALVIETMTSVDLSANLLSIIESRGITHVDLPPSLLRLTNADKSPHCLETIVIGGEPTDSATVRRWSRKVNLINVYGPTEATVCTSLCRCSDNWTIPLIGRELHGITYRIHHNGALDADDGELWISGDCLAIGYYKNDALTEEKFPIINGIRYYRTSDHVKRTADGEIEFIGRYDRQVKFHGQLVELEEIESVLKSMRCVINAAAVKREISDGNRKEMIVAFVEVHDNEDKQLVKNNILKALRYRLPKWMIPGHIELTERLPKVTSGKIDYTILTQCELHEFIAQKEDCYSSEIEEQIARTIADILKIERVNPHDSFFDLGADSLDTLMLIARLQNELNINITLNQLKLNNTPSALSNLRSSGKSMEIFSTDLEGEWKCDFNAIHLSQQSEELNVFITGATGFLGSHILSELLGRAEYDNRTIVCLVRCSSAKHGYERIRNTFERYRLNPKGLERVKILSGDLTEAEFGLDHSYYESLAISTSEVFHCAATVNMMADYETLKKPNVNATKAILSFCLSGKRKKLNYASTLSVFVSTDRNEGIASESDRLTEPCSIFGGYGQTKYVCEKLLLSVPSDLCEINIIRYGLLCGDTSHGIGAPKDFLGMFIRGAKTIKAMPRDATDNLAIDISPVDIASKITVDIATKSNRGIYHVAAENPLRYTELCRTLMQAGHVEICNSYDEWVHLITPLLGNPNVAAMNMSLCRFSQSDYESLRYMDLFQTTNIRFDMTNTHNMTSHRIYQDSKLIELYIQNETI